MSPEFCSPPAAKTCVGYSRGQAQRSQTKTHFVQVQPQAREPSPAQKLAEACASQPALRVKEPQRQAQVESEGRRASERPQEQPLQ